MSNLYFLLRLKRDPWRCAHVESKIFAFRSNHSTKGKTAKTHYTFGGLQFKLEILVLTVSVNAG